MSVQDKVIQILANQGAARLSGEEIANELGVSRAAVWKAVQKLQSEGYAITGTRNQGYSLQGFYDVLTECGVQEALCGEVKQIAKIQVKKSTGSTNDDMKLLAQDGAEAFTCIVAGEQSAGKGRRGRPFYSLGDTGVYLSILLRPDQCIQDAGMITGAAAVAVCRAFENVCKAKPSIKWVNDIYVGKKKVCGILTEGAADLESGRLAYAILGIGVNVYTPQDGFPEGIAQRAGSLLEKLNPNARNLLAAEIINECYRIYNQEDFGSFVGQYQRLSLMEAKQVIVIDSKGNEQSALCLGVNDDLSLRVEYGNGLRADLHSGEVSIVL